MSLFSSLSHRRMANARGLSAYGVREGLAITAISAVRTIREGGGVTIYTVGYERRDGQSLFAALRAQGVKAIADIREHPMSRKPDFRAAALRSLCEHYGIEYQPWPALGSTAEMRDELHASGDFAEFGRQFRAFARKHRRNELVRLAQTVQQAPTVLLCYERVHEECHRSIVAELVAQQMDATILAIQ
jgi:uncharacterized protein (DUF488 family)